MVDYKHKRPKEWRILRLKSWSVCLDKPQAFPDPIIDRVWTGDLFVADLHSTDAFYSSHTEVLR